MVPYLISEGARWVATQRDHHRPWGRALSERERSSLAPYYSASILEAVVVREIPLIENPDFYQALSASGQPIPLDFSQMAGITFVDTIAIAGQRIQPGWEAWLSLLFHECVHVCQYQLLGLDHFIEEYVHGWELKGFDYYAIPLEVQAYRLQSAFEESGQAFSVEQQVLAGLDDKI